MAKNSILSLPLLILQMYQYLILKNIIESSFINAIFRSLWVFSITLAASATLIFGAKYVPALIIELYKLSINFAASGLEPDVTFRISMSL